MKQYHSHSKKFVNFYITKSSVILEACSNKPMFYVNRGLRNDIFFKFAMFIRMWTGFSPMVFFNQSNSLRNCFIARVRIDKDDLYKVDEFRQNGNKQFACHMGNGFFGIPFLFSTNTLGNAEYSDRNGQHN